MLRNWLVSEFHFATNKIIILFLNIEFSVVKKEIKEELAC